MRIKKKGTEESDSVTVYLVMRMMEQGRWSKAGQICCDVNNENKITRYRRERCSHSVPCDDDDDDDDDDGAGRIDK